jgi:hypothetical protein
MGLIEYQYSQVNIYHTSMIRPEREGRLRRKGVMEKEGFKFFKS